MGLGSGDLVDVRDNPLSTTSLNTHIPVLQDRGVECALWRGEACGIEEIELRLSLSRKRGHCERRKTMNRLIYFFALFFMISQPLFAQESGVPGAVDVSNRQTTLTLDFSTHDYELILYSFKTDETDHERTFNFVVTGNFGASKPRCFTQIDMNTGQ